MRNMDLLSICSCFHFTGVTRSWCEVQPLALDADAVACRLSGRERFENWFYWICWQCWWPGRSLGAVCAWWRVSVKYNSHSLDWGKVHDILICHFGQKVEGSEAQCQNAELLHQCCNSCFFAFFFFKSKSLVWIWRYGVVWEVLLACYCVSFWCCHILSQSDATRRLRFCTIIIHWHGLLWMIWMFLSYTSSWMVVVNWMLQAWCLIWFYSI